MIYLVYIHFPHFPRVGGGQSGSILGQSEWSCGLGIASDELKLWEKFYMCHGYYLRGLFGIVGFILISFGLFLQKL